MKPFYAFAIKITGRFIPLVFLMGILNITYAQRATIAVPVSVGSPCSSGNNTTNDSIKYFDYNANTNILTHRFNCQPKLAAPGGTFTDNLSTVTYNPFDGFLYYNQIAAVGTIYNTYTYRWLPQVAGAPACPNSGAPLHPVYRTFTNQFVAGLEFDANTGLGYQINFVDTTGWAPGSVDAINQVGQFTSHATVNGNPAVAYYDATNGDLRYIRAEDNNGSSFALPVAVTAVANNVGQYTSLMVVNGLPAIAYYDVTAGDLKYVRALDVNGATWGVPVTVEATNDVGRFASMTIVNGNPAIAYYDNTNGDLRYIRATDVNGATWGAPLAVEAVNNVGQYASLKVVNGNPAIAFYDFTNGDLRYIRSANVNGTAWGASLNVEATNDVGQYLSMEVVSGNPAIAYYDNTNKDLRYIRATDVSGTAWGAAAAIATAGTIGLHNSLKMVNGNPAISYYDGSNRDLIFIRATNATGTAWGTPLTVEATNDVGQFSSMIISNGNPSIMYYDVTNLDPRFIRAYDANGTKWFKNSQVYNMELQQVNFATADLGNSYPINFGSRKIYKQNGDVVMTPRQQMLAVFDNKYFTINWKDYGTATPLVATFLDTLKPAVLGGAGIYVVGLSYADGKLVAGLNKPSCVYKELDINPPYGTYPITYSAGSAVFSSADMTSITSGIGLSKKLISAVENPVGSKTYDLVYEVVIRNVGTTVLRNVQAYDTLTKINGAGNLLSASITSFTAPPGPVQNPAYDGKTAFVGTQLINTLAGGDTLSNKPGVNEIKLRISCKIANIQPGIIYLNQAVGNATNLFNNALRDSSTNGDNPDPNYNGRSDDAGEAQPTPFIVQLVGSTLPCLNMTKILFEQTFGVRAAVIPLIDSIIPPPLLGVGVTLPIQQTGYLGLKVQPLATDGYALARNALHADSLRFLNILDHTTSPATSTPASPNGQMMVVNADANNLNLYRGGFTFPLCANHQYSLSFFGAFIGNPSYDTVCRALNPSGAFIYPKLRIRIRDGGTLSIITDVSTGSIISTSWQQFGVKFTSPASYASIVFEIINDAEGGCGNDLVLDDIQFGSCDPTPVVGVSTATGCLGNTSTLTGSLSDPGAINGPLGYQWQVSTLIGGPYVNLVNGGRISGATTANLVINPLAAADTGKYYRLLVAAVANITDPNCRFSSTPTLLSGKAPSLAATGASKSRDNICPGVSVTLTRTGGTLGTNASWKWYGGSCGTTLLGTGNSLIVAPTATTTYYVRAEGDCNTTACLPVTIFINCDIDKDDDGVPDFVESNMPAAFLDVPANGIINAYDPLTAGFVDNNGDYVNDNYQANGDVDNDAILNYLDPDFPGRVDSNLDGIDDRFDTDLDGVINMLDLDSDNDGITDVVEAYGVDVNGDGKIDNYIDADGDGLSDNVDSRINPADGAYNTGIGLGLPNLDGDAVPNFLDLDSDNDGIPDLVEAGAPDANNNGKVDGFLDANADGLHDAYINATALLQTGTDINADGRADSYPNKNMDWDFRPNAYDMDSDGDGIIDVIEAGLPDVDFNGIVDGVMGANGWSTTVSAMPALNLRNTDASAGFDFLDIDSDNDGIPDNIEGQTTAAYKTPGIVDTDGDGLVDTYETPCPCPFGTNTIFGGSGIYVNDHDLDNTPDYRDLDTDADGLIDRVEGNDFNLNALPDDNVTLTGLDTDGDGLDNRFDSLNSVTNIKGTSYRMGNLGSFTGDATPGSRTTVQRSFTYQTDRDWRYTSYVLPVQFLSFSGSKNNDNVLLRWTIIADKAVDLFEIERSVNNRDFFKVNTVTEPVALFIQQSFSATDNIAGISSDILYYRLKVIGKAGEIKYSNILVFRLSQQKPATLSISPNPAKDYVVINYTAEKDYEVVIRLINSAGQVMHSQTVKVLKGKNLITLDGLLKYSNGTYALQVFANEEVLTEKLILIH